MSYQGQAAQPQNPFAPGQRAAAPIIPNVPGGAGGGAQMALAQGQQRPQQSQLQLQVIPNIPQCCFKRVGVDLSDDDLRIAGLLAPHCEAAANRNTANLVEFRGMYFQIKDDDAVVGEVIQTLFGAAAAGNPMDTWNRTHQLPANRTVNHAETQQDYPYMARLTANGIVYRAATCGQTCLRIITANHPDHWAASPNGIRRCALMTIVNRANPLEGLGAASNIFVANVAGNAWVPTCPRLASTVHLAQGMPEADARRSRRLNVIFVQ